MTGTRADRESEVSNAKQLVQTAGLVFYLLAIQALFTVGVGIYEFLKGGNAPDLLLSATGAALAVCYGVVGYHLRRYRLWARNFAFAVGVIGLFFFPVGTVLGAGIVVCIERANRAGLFPTRRTPQVAPEADESAPLLRLEPDLSPESAG